MRDAMPCDYACPDRGEHAGAWDCCHTCAYFLGAECVAPQGVGFFPRVMWRIALEA